MFLKNKLFSTLIKHYVFSMLVFTLLRIVFLLFNINNDESYTTSDLLFVFLIGVIVDSSVCSIILVIALIISYPVYYFKKDFFRTLRIVLISLSSVAVLLNVIDCFYYKQFGCRLNYQALEIFHDKERVLLKSISANFPVYKVLTLFISVIFLYYVLHKKIKKQNLESGEIKKKHFVVSLLSLGAMSFLYLGPPFWALATTPSSLLNHSSLNGAYTLIKSIDQHSVYTESIPDYHLCDDKEAVAGLQKIILKKDETLVNTYFPTLRKTNTQLPFSKKNIVIIIMESFGANYIGSCNENGKGFSPYFDQLSKEGVFFTSCRSNGPRTQHGIISTVSGFPAIQGINLQRRKGVNALETIGNALTRDGYNTQYIHNGDASFDDMSDFFKQGGFRSVVDVKDFKTWKYKHEWGVCDEDLYEKAFTLIWSKNNSPTLSVLMTLSNHFPYGLPLDFPTLHPEIKTMSTKQKSFYYSDYALGKFIAKCKSHPEYKNTLFLILADHGEPYVPEDNEFKIFHIPALLLNSSKAYGTFDKICSQCDFASTLLHEINYSGNFHFIGQDIFNESYKPFAFSKPYGNDVLLNTDSSVIRYLFETNVFKYYKLVGGKQLSEIANKKDQEKETFIKQYLQSTSYIFKSGKYTLGTPQKK